MEGHIEISIAHNNTLFVQFNRDFRTLENQTRQIRRLFLNPEILFHYYFLLLYIILFGVFLQFSPITL